MVNTGLPSRDCYTCRRRRVKCDLRRPGCQRCEKFGQACTGYRDLENPDLVFRVQTPTSYVGRRKGRKARERSNVTGNEQHYETESNSLETFSARRGKRGGPKERIGDINHALRLYPGTISPTRRVVESWDMHIMPLIVNQFSFKLPEGGRTFGSLECFSTLLQSVETSSVLYLACHAVGYAYLANKARSSSLILSHRWRYGRAIQALRQALHNPHVQKQDGIFLAVWLLCLYELVQGTSTSGEPEGCPLNWDMHSRALVGLLRLRGRQQFDSKTGCQLFQLAYHTIQINSIQTRRDPPLEASDWFDAAEASINVAKPCFIPLFRFCDETARICSSARALVGEGLQEELLPAANFIFQASKDLESRMIEYFGLLIACPLTSPGEHGEGQMSSQVLRIRNYADASFICLYYSILELLYYAAKSSDRPIDQLEEISRLRRLNILQTQARANRILATLPHFLPKPSNISEEAPEKCLTNWADSLKLLWQIRVIAFSPVVLESQKREAESALLRTGYEVGIMQAVSSYYLSLTDYEALQSWLLHPI